MLFSIVNELKPKLLINPTFSRLNRDFVKINILNKKVIYLGYDHSLVYRKNLPLFDLTG